MKLSCYSLYPHDILLFLLLIRHLLFWKLLQNNSKLSVIFKFQNHKYEIYCPIVILIRSDSNYAKLYSYTNLILSTALLKDNYHSYLKMRKRRQAS